MKEDQIDDAKQGVDEVSRRQVSNAGGPQGKSNQMYGQSMESRLEAEERLAESSK